jgi:hypothetical protein
VPLFHSSPEPIFPQPRAENKPNPEHFAEQRRAEGEAAARCAEQARRRQAGACTSAGASGSVAQAWRGRERLYSTGASGAAARARSLGSEARAWALGSVARAEADDGRNYGFCFKLWGIYWSNYWV